MATRESNYLFEGLINNKTNTKKIGIYNNSSNKEQINKANALQGVNNGNASNTSIESFDSFEYDPYNGSVISTTRRKVKKPKKMQAASSTKTEKKNAKTKTNTKTKTNYSKTNENNNKSLYRTYKSNTKFINNTIKMLPKVNIKQLNTIREINLGKNNKSEKKKGLKIYFVKEKIKPFKTYLIKEITKTSLKFESVKAFLNESKFYNDIMYNFVLNNITPYVIIGANSYLEQNSNKLYLINETADVTRYDVISLFEFIKKIDNIPKLNKIIINLLFQIIYTLKCFNAINFKHQDLHLDNILLFINKSNNILQDSWVLESKYEFILSNTGNPDNDIFYLENIGIQVRIFDFDRSIKMSSRTKIKELNTYIIIEGSQYIIYNNEINPYLDTYKVLSSIYDSLIKKINLVSVEDKKILVEIISILLFYLPLAHEYLKINPQLFNDFDKYIPIKETNPAISREILNLNNAFEIGQYINADGSNVILLDKNLDDKELDNPYKLKFLTRNMRTYTPNPKELLPTEEYLNYLIAYFKNSTTLNNYSTLKTSRYHIIETYDFTKL